MMGKLVFPAMFGILFFVAIGGTQDAFAELKTCNGYTGLWTDSAAWSPPGQPASTDTLNINNCNLTIPAGTNVLIEQGLPPSGIDFLLQPAYAGILDIIIANTFFDVLGSMTFDIDAGSASFEDVTVRGSGPVSFIIGNAQMTNVDVAIAGVGADLLLTGGFSLTGNVFFIADILAIIDASIIVSDAVINLEAARRSANESSAIATQRAVVSAITPYRDSTMKNGVFDLHDSLLQLVEMGLLSDTFIKNEKSGYEFTLSGNSEFKWHGLANPGNPSELKDVKLDVGSNSKAEVKVHTEVKNGKTEVKGGGKVLVKKPMKVTSSGELENNGANLFFKGKMLEPADLEVDGGYFENNSGTTRFTSTSNVQIGNGAIFWERFGSTTQVLGSFTVGSTATYNNDANGFTKTRNGGTFTVDNGGTLNNAGKFVVQPSGTLTLNGEWNEQSGTTSEIYGTYNVGSGGQYDNEAGTTTKVRGTGTFNLQSGGTVNNDGRFVTQSSATTSLSDQFNNNNGGRTDNWGMMFLECGGIFNDLGIFRGTDIQDNCIAE